MFGTMAFYAKKLKRFVPPVYFKFLHNLFGLAAYTTGIASLIFGLDKRTFSSYVSSEDKTGVICCISVIAVFCVIEALRSLYNQIKNLF